jgi:hypothetical protein
MEYVVEVPAQGEPSTTVVMDGFAWLIQKYPIIPAVEGLNSSLNRLFAPLSEDHVLAKDKALAIDEPEHNHRDDCIQ